MGVEDSGVTQVFYDVDGFFDVTGFIKTLNFTFAQIPVKFGGDWFVVNRPSNFDPMKSLFSGIFIFNSNTVGEIISALIFWKIQFSKMSKDLECSSVLIIDIRMTKAFKKIEKVMFNFINRLRLQSYNPNFLNKSREFLLVLLSKIQLLTPLTKTIKF